MRLYRHNKIMWLGCSKAKSGEPQSASDGLAKFRMGDKSLNDE